LIQIKEKSSPPETRSKRAKGRPPQSVASSISAKPAMSHIGKFRCKSRKSDDFENLAKVDFKRLYGCNAL
jgi:hypothetical protein